MADRLGLDYDEVVILQETNVAHGGVMAIYTDELILTNKKIICLHKGMFGGTKQTYHYPLDQIKVFNGMPQVQQGKLSNGTATLTVYLVTGEEQFNFQSSNKKTIDKWITEIKKLFGYEVPVVSSKKQKRKGRFEIEDDSVLGAFKEVSDEFKDVGREFASAFGFKFRDKGLTDEEDEQEENDAVAYKYQLENDEVIILSNESVYVDGDIDNTADVLLLTNKRIVMEYSSGFFNNQYNICPYELEDIKKFKGVPQANLSKYEDEPVLEIYFANAHLYFRFEEVGNKKKQTECIERWVKKIRQAVSEQNATTYPTKASRLIITCKNCGAPIDDGSVFCTNCGAKVEAKTPDPIVREDDYTCKNCGAKLSRDLKFCTECGTAIVIEDMHISKNMNSASSPESAKAKLSIDEQIELLQKLKALVDAGILSQEEFEIKKKEIL